MRKLTILILLFLLTPIFVYADESTSTNNAKCVVDAENIFMRGEYLQVGISPKGSFGALVRTPASFSASGMNDTIGLSINTFGFSSNRTSNTGDYILPDTKEERFMIGYVVGDKDGEVNEIKIAEKNGVSEFPNPIKDLKTECECDYSTGLLKTTTTGISKDNLKITIINEFYNNDKYLKTMVELENLNDETLSYVRYLRSMNPDQDYDLHNTLKTQNKVISNPRPPYNNNMYAMVVATGPVSNESFFYLAYDKRARASFGETDSPSSIYNETLWKESDISTPYNPSKEEIMTTTGYTEVDGYIAITFNLGDLFPKEKVSFEYFSAFSSNIEEEVDSIPAFEIQEHDIRIKNYPNSSNKKDILEISKLNIGDKVELYSDSSMNNKLLTITVDKNNLKSNKLTYKVDKNILDDDGGMIYLKIKNNYENIPLIRYNYESVRDTTKKLMVKRLVYILVIIIDIGLVYYLYKKITSRNYRIGML